MSRMNFIISHLSPHEGCSANNLFLILFTEFQYFNIRRVTRFIQAFKNVM